MKAIKSLNFYSHQSLFLPKQTSIQPKISPTYTIGTINVNGKKWIIEFRGDASGTRDAERPGRPIEVDTAETTKKTHNTLLTDLRLKVRENVEAYLSHIA